MLRKLFLYLAALLVAASSFAADPSYHSYFTKGNQLLKEKRHKEAIAQYEKALELDPKNSQILLRIGIAYSQMDEANKAFQFTKQASSLDPSYTAFYQLGFIYAKKNEFEKSLEAFDRALAINPESYVIEFHKGYVYLAQKEYDKAIQSFRRVIALNPKFVHAHLSLGGAYLSKGDRPSALKQLKILRAGGKDELANTLEKWIKEYRI